MYTSVETVAISSYAAVTMSTMLQALSSPGILVSEFAFAGVWAVAAFLA